MKKNELNIFRNEKTAKEVASIVLANDDFCKLYSISSANMNYIVDESEKNYHNNRVVEIVEDEILAEHMKDSLNLQKLNKAFARITIWLESNAIIVFVGSVFSFHASLVEKSEEEKEAFNNLYNASIVNKWNSRKCKGETITTMCETKHSFTSIDDFALFFNMLSNFSVKRKAVLASEKKAETKSEAKKAEKKEVKKQSTKKQSKNKLQAVSADELAEMTKEVIEEAKKEA